MEKQKVYILGRFYNTVLSDLKVKFEEACNLLRDSGYEPVSYFEELSQIKTYENRVAFNISKMLECDGVFVLTSESYRFKGIYIELSLCRLLGKKILNHRTDLVFDQGMFAKLINLIQELYGFSYEELSSSSRQEDIVNCRRLICFFCLQNHYSRRFLCEKLNKNHTLICYYERIGYSDLHDKIVLLSERLGLNENSSDKSTT